MTGQPAIVIADSACRGADPAITNVTSAHTANSEDLNQYTVTVTVTNLGSAGQKASVLQSVDIFLDGVKNGEKGVPPLRAGQSYSFPYNVLRAHGARHGSTTVRVRLAVHSPAGDTMQDCNMGNDTERISI